jgi:5-carboxymethyl-2-hydroxymuconate isomerase
MPHLTVEYSPGLEKAADIQAVCRAAYAAILKARIFPIGGIRVRAYRADFCIVADDLPENNFLAMTMNVGAGRSPEALRVAGDAIFDAVREVLRQPLSTQHFALSLEMRIIDSQFSWKDTPIHARLSPKS